MGNVHFTEILSNLRDPSISKTEITNQEYWLFYILVRKLKGKYGVRGSFRKPGQYLMESPNSIVRRYCGNKKERELKRFTLPEIIKDQKLNI